MKFFNRFRKPRFVTPEGRTVTLRKWKKVPNSPEETLRADTPLVVVHGDGEKVWKTTKATGPGQEVDPGDYEEIEGF